MGFLADYVQQPATIALAVGGTTIACEDRLYTSSHAGDSGPMNVRHQERKRFTVRGVGEYSATLERVYISERGNPAADVTIRDEGGSGNEVLVTFEPGTGYFEGGVDYVVLSREFIDATPGRAHAFGGLADLEVRAIHGTATPEDFSDDRIDAFLNIPGHDKIVHPIGK